jgi:hypothetical protein
VCVCEREREREREINNDYAQFLCAVDPYSCHF